jgi:purine-nucleoside phosphorylase
MQSLAVYLEYLRKNSLPLPSYHVVLGSGYGAALDSCAWEMAGEISFTALPGFPASTVPDHAGCYRFYRRGKHVVCFQMGRLHGYEGHSPSVVVQTVMLPRLAGVRNFVLTNASGALSPHLKPGDVMLLRDHVNLTGGNPLVGANPKGPDGKELGPRFPDLSRMYDHDWRARIEKQCFQQGLGTHEGVYLGLLGPSFETPAEVRLFAAWGLSAVGMSTVWEAIALSHSGARVAGLSLISNPASGLGEGQLDHLKILETCRASAAKIVGALLGAFEEELGK